MDHVKEGFKERIKNTKLGYGLGLDDKQTIQKGQVVTFVGLPNAGKSSLLNKIAD
jgi:tRNA U34 5-carboxymethylaminomethyl modifying GTPase MnmE/TrmE